MKGEEEVTKLARVRDKGPKQSYVKIIYDWILGEGYSRTRKFGVLEVANLMDDYLRGLSVTGQPRAESASQPEPLVSANERRYKCERCGSSVAESWCLKHACESPQPEPDPRPWRVGTKVPYNVYEGDRPICQCHTALDAKRIVEAVNAAHAERVPKEPR